MDPDIETDDMIIGDLRKSILAAKQTKPLHVNTPKEWEQLLQSQKPQKKEF